ncbi:MAG: hypothetical protein AAF266_02095 [Planctomycetota bacterium]
MFRKRHTKVGARPGTLVISKESPEPRMTLIAYTPDGVEERSLASADDLRVAFDDEQIA